MYSQMPRYEKGLSVGPLSNAECFKDQSALTVQLRCDRGWPQDWIGVKWSMG